jgi:hypothetical protein
LARKAAVRANWSSKSAAKQVANEVVHLRLGTKITGARMNMKPKKMRNLPCALEPKARKSSAQEKPAADRRARRPGAKTAALSSRK